MSLLPDDFFLTASEMAAMGLTEECYCCCKCEERFTGVGYDIYGDYYCPECMRKQFEFEI